ncbi:MAG: hypothetical protein ACE14L_02965 [Terriglobales bacterium]
MARNFSVAAMGLLVVIGGLLLAGEYVVLRRSHELCSLCQRSINPRARVMAEIGGERRNVCCAHCAITEGIQQRKPVRFLWVTDYNSGAHLDPAKAWYVEGSRVLACEHDMAHMDMSKHPQQLSFDRCSPGTFAFGSRVAAEAFAQANGGVVLPYEAVMRGTERSKARLDGGGVFPFWYFSWQICQVADNSGGHILQSD